MSLEEQYLAAIIEAADTRDIGAVYELVEEYKEEMQELARKGAAA